MICKKCNHCYFGDQCGNEIPCDDFAPLTEMAEEYEMFRQIEIERQIFNELWRVYISEKDI